MFADDKRLIRNSKSQDRQYKGQMKRQRDKQLHRKLKNEQLNPTKTDDDLRVRENWFLWKKSRINRSNTQWPISLWYSGKRGHISIVSDVKNVFEYLKERVVKIWTKLSMTKYTWKRSLISDDRQFYEY